MGPVGLLQSAMMRKESLALTLIILPLAAGCQQPEFPTIPQMDHGLVWIFPGVEGGEWSLSGAKQAFRDSGCQAAFRVHDWSHPLGIIVNLVSYERNREHAAEVAEQIVQYRRAFREGPIDLVGYSGGGGMAVMVAEALPPGIRLRNVILVQPALSPEYDLSPTLRRIDGTLVNFHSPYDYVLLGAGTKLLGTMDRKHTSSAGKNGFDLELAVPDPRLRRKVEQRTWSSEMADTGHIGMHMGILLYDWNLRYVAPYLAAEPMGLADSDPRTYAPEGPPAEAAVSRTRPSMLRAASSQPASPADSEPRLRRLVPPSPSSQPARRPITGF